MNFSPRSILGTVLLATSLVAAAYLAGCSSESVGREAALDSYVQGVLAYSSGDSNRAISQLQDAINQHPDLVMAHSLLGDLYQSKQYYKDALKQYQATTRLDPYEYKNYYNEGLMLQLLHRAKDAIAAYLHALQLNPTDALSNQNLGIAYLKLNDVGNALKYCQRAVELNDHSAPAWSNLAVVLDANHRYNEAEGAYRHALELDSIHPEIAVALANNLIEQKRFAEAQSVMGGVVRTNETAPHRKRLGDTLAHQKKYDEALGEYARCLKLDPLYYPALNETGWMLITQYNNSLGLDESKRTAALDAWQKSLLLKPDQSRISELMNAYAMKFSDQEP